MHNFLHKLFSAKLLTMSYILSRHSWVICLDSVLYFFQRHPFFGLAETGHKLLVDRCVCSQCSTRHGHTGQLSKQFQEAGQSLCHSVSQHHIQQISGTIWAVMKHIGIVKCVYVGPDVTLLEAHERFIKVHKVTYIEEHINCICKEGVKQNC